jgi:hypothetical protein
MAQSTDAIVNKEVFRDNGYVPVFNALGGTGLQHWDLYWKTRIPKLLAAVHCDANVVMLGNNDSGNAGVLNDPDLYVRRFLDALGNGPLVYVTPDRATIVDSIERVTASRENSIVIEVENIQGWQSTDGTHPTASGEAALAQAIENALDRFFGTETDSGSPYNPPRSVPASSTPSRRRPPPKKRRRPPSFHRPPRVSEMPRRASPRVELTV